MFALVVVFGNVQWNSEIGRWKKNGFVTKQNAAKGQARDVLENVGVFDGLSR